jgi:hypothetical protein
MTFKFKTFLHWACLIPWSNTQSVIGLSMFLSSSDDIVVQFSTDSLSSGIYHNAFTWHTSPGKKYLTYI